jgi:hypothetical protein
MAAGMLRHRMRDAAFFTFSGLLLKYVVLTLIFN